MITSYQLYLIIFNLSHIGVNDHFVEGTLTLFSIDHVKCLFTDSLIGVYVGDAIATKKEKKKTINGLVVGIAFILTYMNCNFLNIYINGLHFSKVYDAEDI